MQLKNEDFFQIFGHITVFFSTLDTLVTVTILRLVEKNQRVKATAMNDRTTLQQKFRLLQQLQSHQVVDDVILSELQNLIPNALIIGERRNRFIHDTWVFKPEDIESGKITRMRVKELDDWKFSIEPEEEITMASLQNYLNELGRLQKQFGSVLERLPIP